jgi:hypothetical protein
MNVFAGIVNVLKAGGYIIIKKGLFEKRSF